jgi:transposase
MAYITGISRKEQMLLPDVLDEYIGEDNPARIIDAFVESLDIEGLGFSKAVPKEEGRSPYNPRDLLKLYIYGYHNKVRSSRKLSNECGRNVEVMWLVKKIQPKFVAVSEFRKNNKKAIRKVFGEFNRLCAEMDLFGKEYVAIDGTKIRAQNAKDNNFTLNKLDDRLKRLEGNLEEYLLLLDKNDKEEKDELKLSREQVEAKIQELSERKARYEEYRDGMAASGESQISLTDPESRLMKFADGGFNVGYNVQTAVDAKNHLIADFQVTNAGTDHGLLESTAEGVKEVLEVEKIDITADKGYNDREDMVKCLENGNVPNVCAADGEDGYDLESEYKEAKISDEERASGKPEDIRKCLRAGVVPEVYAKIISGIEIAEEKVYENEEETTGDPIDDLAAKAKEGYFVRDREKDFVICPELNILRAKAAKRSGAVRYCNKLACKECRHKCTTAKWKEVDFFPGVTTVECKGLAETGKGKDRRKGKRRKVIGTKKVVRFHLKVDRNKTANRKCLSEHPFGTLKRYTDGTYISLRGTVKVTAEMSLNFLSYNLKRAVNILGTARILAYLEA